VAQASDEFRPAGPVPVGHRAQWGSPWNGWGDINTPQYGGNGAGNLWLGRPGMGCSRIRSSWNNRPGDYGTGFAANGPDHGFATRGRVDARARHLSGSRRQSLPAAFARATHRARAEPWSAARPVRGL